MFGIYSIILGLGAALGMAWVAWRVPKEEISRWMDGSLWVLLGILVGARAGYVIANWVYYQAHGLEIPQIWLGGLSGPGAIAGGLVSLAILAFARKESLGKLADGMLSLALPLIVATWLAAWETGVYYGVQISNSWWLAAPTPDEWGTWSGRLPLQPVGAIVAIAIFAGVGLLRPHFHSPGKAASLAFIGLSLSLFGLSFLRADPALVWRGWRLDTWAALLFSALAILSCLVAFWPKKKPSPSPLPLRAPETSLPEGEVKA